MKCPNCSDVTLVMTERQGVEIDYCPQCRGVWLDRGELDKLIERSATISPNPPVQQAYSTVPRYKDFKDSGYDHHSGHHAYRKRKSWLSELFD